MSSFPSKPHELRVHVLHFSQHFLVFQFFFRMAKFCLQMTRRVLNSPTFLWQSSSKGLSLSTWSGLFQQWPSPREQLSLWVISSLPWTMTKTWTWQEAQSNLREAQFLLVCSCHVKRRHGGGGSPCASSLEGERGEGCSTVQGLQAFASGWSFSSKPKQSLSPLSFFWSGCW